MPNTETTKTTKMIETLSTPSGVSLKIEDNGNYVVSSPQFSFTLKQISPGIGSAISALFEGGKTQEQLSDMVAKQDDWMALPQFSFFLDHFAQRGIIKRTLWSGDHLLATILPIAFQEQRVKQVVQADTRYVLSRFALLRNKDGQLILESPLSRVQIILHSPVASVMVTKLTKPHLVQELAEITDEMLPLAVKDLLTILLNAKLVFETDENGNSREIQERDLVQWEFHDLLFHSRTRLGRHNNGYGGTFRFLETFDPLPALKPLMSDQVIVLDRPDLAEIEAQDLPFTTVVEKRKSIPVQGHLPLSKAQLSEFLYRVARVRLVIQTERGEVSNRPYPSGGAIYELEIYPVVNCCEGLDSGLYHYLPDVHQLCQVSGRTTALESLLELARVIVMGDTQPQILIVLTARFPRISWKYESIAYALVLKHVGILYQSMYLVATAMGLAPCALGSGNSDLFAQAAGIDYLAEGAVGEFILGTLPDEVGQK